MGISPERAEPFRLGWRIQTQVFNHVTQGLFGHLTVYRTLSIAGNADFRVRFKQNEVNGQASCYDAKHLGTVLTSRKDGIQIDGRILIVLLRDPRTLTSTRRST